MASHAVPALVDRGMYTVINMVCENSLSIKNRLPIANNTMLALQADSVIVK